MYIFKLEYKEKYIGRFTLEEIYHTELTESDLEGYEYYMKDARGLTDELVRKDIASVIEFSKHECTVTIGTASDGKSIIVAMS